MAADQKHGVAIDATITDAISRGAVVAMSLSGGKDSTAAAFEADDLLDAAGHPRSRRLAVHADLGRAKWRQTPSTVEAIANRLNLPLHVVRHSRHDMVSRWQDRFARGLARYAALETLCLIGPWSSPSLRFCTSELKTAPIARFLRARYPGGEIISVIGIRREESPRRRLSKISGIDEGLTDARGTRGLVWHPLVDWTTADVFELHATAELPLHEAYTAFGSTRLSCGFCIMSSLRDMLASVSCDGNHDLYRLLVDLEIRSTFSFQPTRWLADVAPHLPSSYQRDRLDTAKCLAADRRAIEAALPVGLRYVNGWPPRLPTIDEANAIAAARQTIAGHHCLDAAHLSGASVRDRFAELMSRAAARRLGFSE